jgi:hypothetical protein
MSRAEYIYLWHWSLLCLCVGSKVLYFALSVKLLLFFLWYPVFMVAVVVKMYLDTNGLLNMGNNTDLKDYLNEV